MKKSKKQDIETKPKHKKIPKKPKNRNLLVKFRQNKIDE